MKKKMPGKVSYTDGLLPLCSGLEGVGSSLERELRIFKKLEMMERVIILLRFVANKVAQRSQPRRKEEILGRSIISPKKVKRILN